MKTENNRLNEINEELEEKVYIKEEEISSLKEKVVDQIEEELNYEFKIEQLQKTCGELTSKCQELSQEVE